MIFNVERERENACMYASLLILFDCKVVNLSKTGTGFIETIFVIKTGFGNRNSTTEKIDPYYLVITR